MSDGQNQGGAGDGQGGGAADILGGEAAAGGGGEGGGAGGEADAGGEAGAGEAAAGGAAAGGADPEWYSQLPAEVGDGESASMRDWVKSVGAKDVASLAKIARDNQKALRESGRVKVPGEGASEAELAEFRKAIGVPEDAKGYKMPELTDAQGKPVELNSDRLGEIAGWAHEAGVPAGALERVLQKVAEADMQEMAGREIELSKEAADHVKKWGGEKDNKLAAVDNAASLLGLKRDEMLKIRAALGPARALDVLADLGARVSEDTLVSGDKRQRFAGDPVAAQRELDEMKSSPDIRDKVFIKGTPEKARWDRLQGIVGAAEEQKARENA
jgi:hypothetical protein